MGALISARYLAEQRRLHGLGAYGVNGGRYRGMVLGLMAEHGLRSVLDYGCGAGDLAASLPNEIDVREYDPAIPGKDAAAAPAELVVCTDVLEHVEPNRLAAVIADLRFVTGKVLLAAIATRPAGKWLSDGRNAHLIVKPAEWWRERLEGSFRIKRVWDTARAEWVAMMRPR